MIYDKSIINDDCVKFWVYASGIEVKFPFCRDHFSVLNDGNEGDSKYPDQEIKDGGIRVLKYRCIIAFEVYEVTKESVYKVITFLRKRLMFTDEVITVYCYNTGINLEFNIFKALCSYYNLKLN